MTVADLIPIASEDRALDLGCGDGSLTRRLARLATKGLAVGVDASEEMVRLARRLSIELDNVMFVLGSPEEIPWREDFFSALVSLQAAAWPQPERSAREMFRVLAPGGRVFLQGPAEWQTLLEAAGFQAVSARPAEGQGPLFLIEARKPPLPPRVVE